MDAFKQNWGQRMQHDPYVNFVLNSDKREKLGKPSRIEYYYYVGKGKPRIMTPAYKEYDGAYYKKTRRRWTTASEKTTVERQKLLPKEMQGINWIREDPIPLPTLLHDNTRPQSLYKLHYPSLR